MLKDITLGQYFPGDTVVHRLDPRTKLLTGHRLYRGAVPGEVGRSPTQLMLAFLVTGSRAVTHSPEARCSRA